MDLPNEEVKMTRAEKIQISFLVLTMVLICVMIVAIAVLVKNVDEIKSFPVQYAVDKGLVNSCTCSDASGNTQYFGNEINRIIIDT